MADGVYASRANIQECKDMGIRPLIPIQARCNARGMGTGDTWGEAVREQLGGSPETRIGSIGMEEREENKRYWKSKVGYNRRWLIEIIISAFKRMFGVHMHSRKWERMVQKIRLRAAQYTGGRRQKRRNIRRYGQTMTCDGLCRVMQQTSEIGAFYCIGYMGSEMALSEKDPKDKKRMKSGLADVIVLLALGSPGPVIVQVHGCRPRDAVREGRSTGREVRHLGCPHSVGG